MAEKKVAKKPVAKKPVVKKPVVKKAVKKSAPKIAKFSKAIQKGVAHSPRKPDIPSNILNNENHTNMTHIQESDNKHGFFKKVMHFFMGKGK
jgi:hypothetical protein